AGVAHEVFEQGELARGQPDRPAAAGGPAGGRVEREVLEPEGGRGLARLPAEERADARQELVEGKGLRQVVVGAEVETRDLVGDGVASGEEQHRGRHLFVAERLEDRQAVTAGQHHVEDDEVVGKARQEAVEGVGAVLRDLDRVAFFLEALADEVRDLALVLDDQYPHGSRRLSYARPPRASGAGAPAGRPTFVREQPPRRPGLASSSPARVRSSPSRHAGRARRGALSLRDDDGPGHTPLAGDPLGLLKGLVDLLEREARADQLREGILLAG